MWAFLFVSYIFFNHVLQLCCGGAALDHIAIAGRTDDDLKRGKIPWVILHMGAFYVSDTMCITWDEFK